jgi:hypothetical protein
MYMRYYYLFAKIILGLKKIYALMKACEFKTATEIMWSLKQVLNKNHIREHI